jgi:hypothetical protein
MSLKNLERIKEVQGPHDSNFVINYEIKRQAMYYKRNIQAHSRNHCCSGKAINISYPKCVSVA